MCVATYIAILSMLLAPMPTEGKDATASSKPSLDPSFRALELHEKGQRCYENADLRCAIQFWTLAYHELDGYSELLSQQTTLVFLITSAQLEIFAIDSQQSQQLRAAQELLKNHLHLMDTNDEVDEANRQAIQERLQNVEHKLMQIKSATSAKHLVTPQTTIKPSKTAKILTISGSVLGGTGLSLLGIMGVGIHLGLAADRNIHRTTLPTSEDEKNQVRSWIRQGNLGNQLAYGAGITGGILLAAAIPMIAIGQIRKRKQISTTPAVSSRFSGIYLLVRF